MAKRAGRTVLTYGTFDLFHIGHVRILSRLAALGDRLVVGLSSDEFNAINGKEAIMSYEDRAEILMSCRYVDEVFPENCWEQKIDDVARVKADVFGMGHDWQGKFDFLIPHCAVIYLPRTDAVSTTELKQTVLRRVA